MAEYIASTKNKLYKYIRSLAQKKYRTREGVFTVEGIKSVRDALASDMEVVLTAVSEDFRSSAEFDCPENTVVVRSDIFDALCDTKTPQGIIAVIKMKEIAHYTLEPSRLYIYCDNVSDPGNLGAIIRTADAAGFGAVLLSPGCADLYSPKVVRASMGSFFNIDVICGFGARRLLDAKSNGFSLYCGALRADSVPYTDADFTRPAVLMVGNEANGASEEILAMSEHIIIPIYGKAESLNAAAAAAVMMYEAVRQRGGNRGGGSANGG